MYHLLVVDSVFTLSMTNLSMVNILPRCSIDVVTSSAQTTSTHSWEGEGWRESCYHYCYIDSLHFDKIDDDEMMKIPTLVVCAYPFSPDPQTTIVPKNNYTTEHCWAYECLTKPIEAALRIRTSHAIATNKHIMVHFLSFFYMASSKHVLVWANGLIGFINLAFCTTRRDDATYSMKYHCHEIFFFCWTTYVQHM